MAEQIADEKCAVEDERRETQKQYGLPYLPNVTYMARYHFVVWCPQRTSITVVGRDAQYGHWLIECARDLWTTTKSVPVMVRKLANDGANSGDGNVRLCNHKERQEYPVFRNLNARPRTKT